MGFWVDRLIGKNHLFKRSIILIKAWCYYESRIWGSSWLDFYIWFGNIGALHFPSISLILDGPLAFEWSDPFISLPDIVVETPENGGGDLLLSNDFLRECVDMELLPNKKCFHLWGSEARADSFPARRKHGDELLKFSLTLDRHGNGQWPDVQDPAPLSIFRGFGATSPVSVTCLGGKQILVDPLVSRKVLQILCVSARHAPHLYFCNSSLDNGEMRNGNLEHKQPENSGSTEKNASCGILPAGLEEMGANVHSYHNVNQLAASQGVQSPCRKSRSFELMSDLCGDYDANIRSLSYGQWCYDYSSSALFLQSSPLVSQLQSKNSWDVVRKSVQFRRNAISPMNANGEGTQLARSPRNNGHAITPRGKCTQRSRELAQIQTVNQGVGKSGVLELRHSAAEKALSHNANGSLHQPDRLIELGQLGLYLWYQPPQKVESRITRVLLMLKTRVPVSHN
ncbi:hypothetical protein F3Y22_tig00110195pilonHSYRG00023 [Hibiscus syriacus]|uniref:PAP/OAS1 substrate-binding-related domain-containing protein n=1 Tax=Hibiscus syriacus TaxID=106335 RepID=A0A6A3BEF7_HIBSY|nr:hypothetical protein F3Y22_tig00110195pilonHSYRG00023 [Hibiscus syriacus]